jgi:CubicO group peptidase (beta-lactamase class C family)
MEEEVNLLMQRAGVPGLSLAIINDSKIVYSGGFGVKNRKTGELTDENTVFAGASFSKTVFAYLVMLLVEEGLVGLDQTLATHLSKPLPDYEAYSDLKDDPRWQLITPRMCLSHSTGFPNWRFSAEDKRLHFLFNPGERHSYSGEGVALLQMVVEEVTGEGLEELSSKRIFQPLGMSRTSYVWQDEWSTNTALPHDQYERPKRLNRRHEPEAAGSIFTTASDYARLLQAILTPKVSREKTVAEMLQPQVFIHYQNMFGPGAWQESDRYDSISLSWTGFLPYRA